MNVERQPGSQPQYWSDIEDQERTERLRNPPAPKPTVEIYFQDPVPLAFKIPDVYWTDDKDKWEGVPLRVVWEDPLARTLWLAIKERHITCQHFRQSCVDQAQSLRARPRKTSADLYLHTGDHMGSLSREFCRQIFPYISRILIDEGRWPYLPPGKDEVSDHVLGYVYREPTK